MVQDGMIVGLGTGLDGEISGCVAGQAREGRPLKIIGVPTSEATRRSGGESLTFPLGDLGDHSALDMTIDGGRRGELGTLNLLERAWGGAFGCERKLSRRRPRQFVINRR